MPELKEFEVRGRNIKKGDVVVLPGDIETSPIVKIDAKTKYVWIDGEDGTQGRVGVNDTVVVKRMVPTAEEDAARLRAETMRYLRTCVASFQAEYDKAREKLTAKLSEPWGADHWDFEQMAIATAKWRIWNKIVHDWAKAQEFENNELTLRDVVQQHVNEFAIKLMRDTRYLSVSTSEWSNVIDKTEAEVMRDFVRTVCGYRTDIEPQIDLRNRFF